MVASLRGRGCYLGSRIVEIRGRNLAFSFAEAAQDAYNNY